MAFRRACELISKLEKLKNQEAMVVIKDENLYDAFDASRNTLMHHAAKVGNHEIVKFLVDLNCAVDARNNLKQTPLVSNLKSDLPCKKIVEILLKANVNAYIQDQENQSALDIVNSETWLNENIERFEIYKIFLENARNFFADFKLLGTGTENTIKTLLQTNIDVSLTDLKGTTLVHAIAANVNPGIVTLLRDKHFNVNSRDCDGWTILMRATIHGSFNMVEFLLDKGADIEIEGFRFENPLAITFANMKLDEGIYKCIQILLERGASAQIVDVAGHPTYTLFDLVLGHKRFIVGELMLADLALQEEKGTTIKQLIRNKIDSHRRFKDFFERCKQQLSMKIYRSVTLFDVLTVSERKLELYLRDKNFALNLKGFESVDYYDTILRKRESKAISMIELRSAVGPVIGKLIKIDYVSYPFVLDAIANCLEKNDLECLISIQNEL